MPPASRTPVAAPVKCQRVRGCNRHCAAMMCRAPPCADALCYVRAADFKFSGVAVGEGLLFRIWDFN